MQSAFIITDKNGKPYAVVGILAGGTEFHPIAESARTWSAWMGDEYAARKITKEQLTATLDNSMSVEGPVAANRTNKAKLDALLENAKKPAQVKPIEAAKTEAKELLPIISLMDARIDNLEDSEWRNAVNFKAKSFIHDSNKSTFAYEVKRTRATWDPTLAVPGTDRRGGWRCPVGTRYGGQITDRFGRNCGWGVARRLANEISDLGERMENVGDQRRVRRVARRNERVARNMAGGAGRIERAAGRVARALDTNDRDNAAIPNAPDAARPVGRIERAAGRLADALDTSPKKPSRRQRGAVADANRRERPGFLENLAGRVAGALDSGESDNKPAPRRPRPQAPQARQARPRQAPRNRNPFKDMSDNDLRKEWDNNKPYIPANGRIGMNPQIEEDKRKRRRQIEAEMQRRGLDLPEDNSRLVINMPPSPNNAPRRPRQPRQPQVDNVSNVQVPAGAPLANESLDDYKRRKYNEHQARVRKVRDQGGNAGFLRYDEWERFHGPMVEDNWNRRRQQNAGRGARRVATNAGGARAATRRPNAADAPDANQPARRQRLPFAPYKHQRGLASEEAGWRKLDAINNDPNNMDMRQLHLVEHNGKHYVVNGQDNLQRALDAGAVQKNRNQPRPAAGVPQRILPSQPSTPSPPPTTQTPLSPTTPPSPPRPNVPMSGNRRGLARPVNRIMDRRQKSLPQLAGQNGRVRRVPVGNAGINNAEDAKRFTGSLNDVPDEFLQTALEARCVDIVPMGAQRALYAAVRNARENPQSLSPADKAELLRLKTSGKSFVKVGGGSITAPTFYLHIADDGSIDGRGYLYKPQDPMARGRGQHSELVGIELARRMGFAQGMPRVVKKNTKAELLLELGPNFAEGHVAALQASQVSDERSRLGNFIANMMLQAGDRHGNNGMYFPGDGALPIDFGRGFANDRAPITAASMAGYSFSMLDARPVTGYKKLVSDGVLTEAQAKARMKADLAEWKSSIQAMFDDGSYDALARLVPNKSSGDDHFLDVSARKGRIQERLALLDSDEFVEALWSRR